MNFVFASHQAKQENANYAPKNTQPVTDDSQLSVDATEIKAFICGGGKNVLHYLDHVQVFELAGEVQRRGAYLVLGGRHGAEAEEELEDLGVAVAAGTRYSQG